MKVYICRCGGIVNGKPRTCWKEGEEYVICVFLPLSFLRKFDGFKDAPSVLNETLGSNWGYDVKERKCVIAKRMRGYKYRTIWTHDSNKFVEINARVESEVGKAVEWYKSKKDIGHVMICHEFDF